MPDMSRYMMQAIADFFFRPSVAAPVRPTAHVMSLWVSVIDAAAGTGVELTTGTAPGYVRSAVTFGNITIPAGVDANNFTVLFPTNTGGGNWATATYYGIHDQVGNLLQALKALTTPITVTPGSHAEGAAGNFTITLG